jgi:peptidoglycan/xylan/chitin deacetylase (PgdA/CDA1 family)
MNKLSYNKLRHVTMAIAADTLWRIPGSFGIARILGRSYSLRCVVFHNVADTQSPFTAGIKVSITPKKFEDTLRFLTAHYSPVRLQDILTDCNGRGLPPRPLLVTFDDAYASVAEWAAPLCHKYGVPAVFFVNAAFLDNQQLAPDNFVCYVANMLGMEMINAAIRVVPGYQTLELHSLAAVFSTFFPAVSPAEREVFLDALQQLSGLSRSRMAKDANLYLTSKQLRNLASFDFEIGNHTYTHTHCRCFSKQDFVSEVDRNRSELEGLSGTKIRSFSQPYGSSKDLTSELAQHLERSGHQAIFLSESVANPRRPDLFHLDRISTCAESDAALFFEIEVMPRLRAIRNKIFQNSAPTRAIQVHSSANQHDSMHLDNHVKASDRRKRA